VPLSPLYQNGAVGIGDLGDEVVNFLHLGARADDVLETILLLDDLPQIPIFADETLIVEARWMVSCNSSTLKGLVM